MIDIKIQLSHYSENNKIDPNLDTFEGTKSVPEQKKSKAYYAASCLSLGIVPIARWAFAKLARKLIMQSLSISEKDKANLDDHKLKFRTNNPYTTRTFELTTGDGARIDGMTIFKDEKSKENFNQGNSDQKWIILVNGNADHYENKLDFVKGYGQEVGANVLVFNYRGVGRSEKEPVKADDLVQDLDTCFQFLQSKGIKDENIVLHGYSLGGGVATQAAALHPAAGLINQNSFSSLSSAAKTMPVIGGIAAKLLKNVGWELDSLAKWEGLKKKLVVFHKHDGIIPYKEASLYKAIKDKIKAANPDNVFQEVFKGKIKARLRKSLKPESIKQIKMRGTQKGDSWKDKIIEYTPGKFPEGLHQKTVKDFGTDFKNTLEDHIQDNLEIPEVIKNQISIPNTEFKDEKLLQKEITQTIETLKTILEGYGVTNQETMEKIKERRKKQTLDKSFNEITLSILQAMGKDPDMIDKFNSLNLEKDGLRSLSEKIRSDSSPENLRQCRHEILRIRNGLQLPNVEIDDKNTDGLLKEVKEISQVLDGKIEEYTNLNVISSLAYDIEYFTRLSEKIDKIPSYEKEEPNPIEPHIYNPRYDQGNWKKIVNFAQKTLSLPQSGE